MRNNIIKKAVFYLFISFMLIIFLATFSISGCGRRALIRERLRASADSEESLSVSGQSSDSVETLEEDSSGEEGATEEKSTEQQKASDEADEQGSISEQDEETLQEDNTDMEVEEETTREDLNEEEAVEQEEQEPVSTNVLAVESEGGNLTGDQIKNTSDALFVGEASSGQEIRVYISYDISELSGSIISLASISVTAESKTGNPFETYGPIIVKAIYWGKNPVPFNAYDLDGVELENFSRKDFTVENEILREDLQNAVDSGSERYQVTLYFEIDETDGDGLVDQVYYKLANMVFNVSYVPPTGG